MVLHGFVAAYRKVSISENLLQILLKKTGLSQDLVYFNCISADKTRIQSRVSGLSGVLERVTLAVLLLTGFCNIVSLVGLFSSG